MTSIYLTVLYVYQSIYRISIYLRVYLLLLLPIPKSLVDLVAIPPTPLPLPAELLLVAPTAAAAVGVPVFPLKNLVIIFRGVLYIDTSV